ncbi:MAG: hypothetical protein PF541_00745 [Prolixibacteraceae bacterium]|nr:hypothetical protein [Prolixibacteraceae bacterium]
MRAITRKEIEDLLVSLYSKADYDVMFDRASKDKELFLFLWEIIKEKPEKESWRIMWILDHASEKKNDFLLPIRDEIYERIMQTDNESFLRHAMKLILRCPINEDFAGELLERCIQWMNDPKKKISSQGLGLEFFFRIVQLYPEMSPELIAHIDDIMERSPSAGMKVRLREIRGKLG